MGVREKLKSKLGRDPTEAEIAEHKAKKAAKKAKAQEVAPSPSTGSAPSAPAPSSEAPKASSAKKSKPNKPKIPILTVTAAKAFGAALAQSARSAANLAGGSEKPGDTEFKAAWEPNREAAKTLLADAEKQLREIPEDRLSEAARGTLLQDLKDTLSLACTPATRVLEDCASTVEGKRGTKRKRGAAGASPGSGAGRKVVAKPDVLASAIAKLTKFDFDIFDAVSKRGSDSLSTDELKQICISKGLYKGPATRMEQIKMLTTGGADFSAERRAAASS